VAIAVSLVALLFSTFVFLYNRRASKRELLLRIHDQQLAADRQHGRRVLFEMAEQGQPPDDLSDEDHRAANHALAVLDLMGFLYCKRYIPRRDAMDLWARTTTRLVNAAEISGFLALRDAQNGAPIWPYLRRFAADARRRTHLVEHPRDRNSIAPRPLPCHEANDTAGGTADFPP
jgi:hypothetical protein